VSAVIASRRLPNNEHSAMITENDISQECKASILASEVYGVNASSIQELNAKIARSKPMKIKNRR
jgi:hypothetical protein